MTAEILMMIGRFTLAALAASAPSGEPSCLVFAGPKPKVPVLGTFHRENPNLDYVKSTAEDRIAVNALRLASSPDDRILVLFGSGHGPLLRHHLSESPRIALVDVDPHLR